MSSNPVRTTDARWPRPEAKSALVVLVPEAEALVGGCCIVHDPAAAAGVPEHITVTYLFMPPARIDTVVTGHLRSCFQRFAPLEFSLSQERKFPGMQYLAPEPADGFRALSLAIWQAYPDYPPYGGKHPDITPRLMHNLFGSWRVVSIFRLNATGQGAGEIGVT